jgi:hypothetical protein
VKTKKHPVTRRRVKRNRAPKSSAARFERVTVDFPTEFLRAIDREATWVGVTRQEWIKIRLADVLPKD